MKVMDTRTGRRQFMAAGTLAGAALLTNGCRTSAAPEEGAAGAAPPNLVLITAEDMGIELGCYGDRTVPTPRLDTLAAEGLLFENAYVTQASCSPSRSSILTGLYPHQNMQLGLSHWGYRMHRGIPNLPSLLDEGGYRTGVAGKIHVAPEREVTFHERGPGHSKDVAAYGAWAESFLTRKDARPFFMYVNFADCHKPFARQFKGIPENPVSVTEVDPFPSHRGLTDESVLEETAGYYHGVQRVDVGVGLILDALRRTGHEGDTLVLFIGDHGPPVARGKTTTYEFGIRIPFLMRWPGQSRPGSRSPALVSTVDILPTFLSAAGLGLPRPLAGKPLQPLLQNPSAPWRDVICAEWNTHGPGFTPQRCIRDSRYKLIHNLRTDTPKPGANVDGSSMAKAVAQPKYDDTPVRRVFKLLENPPEYELYDLKQDPAEYNNLAGKAEFRAIEDHLRQALLAWRKETRDPLLDPDLFRALRQSYADYKASLPELRKNNPGKKRFAIDMAPFQRDWEDVLREDYGMQGAL